MSKKQLIESQDDFQSKTLLLGVYVLSDNQWTQEDYFAEFTSLADTAGYVDSKKMLLRLRNPSSTNFLSKGKLDELIIYCQSNEIEYIVCSCILSSLQMRNLEKLTGAEIIDRSRLILDIFKKAAVSGEGKLQVEIAEMKLNKTRLAGMGKGLDQQVAGVTARGPGETEKEFLTRYYDALVGKAEKKLTKLQKVRDSQRQHRLKSQVPLVCLIGYTNAGKSSVHRVLTGSEVLVEDKLFATLDTTTRELYLSDGRKALLSDTVGFINHLPHQLIQAFRSTLDETRYADLLLHIIDLHNPSWRDQIAVVNRTLQELGALNPQIYVFNKIDLLTEQELAAVRSEIVNNYSPAIFINTRSKEGVGALKELLITHKFTKQGGLISPFMLDSDVEYEITDEDDL